MELQFIYELLIILFIRKGDDMEFQEGTLIKGKNLKNCLLCKILPENMIIKRFQYHIGENVDVNPLVTEGKCKLGLHFTELNNMMGYLYTGTLLALVEVPEDEDVCVDDNAFRTHSLIIKEVLPLKNLDTWKYLAQNEVDITLHDNIGIFWASEKGHFEVTKYLYQNSRDITVFVRDNAIILAAENGHLDIVKFWHQNKADIESYNNAAIMMAAGNGHLDVVKYLYENGADIATENNCPLRWASEKGYFEVVKYLHENGADITANDNFAIRCAAGNGHLEIVKYLHENGADITARNNDVLCKATKNGHLEVVKYFMDNVSD